MHRLVPDDGPLSARIVVIGEAPGRWEDLKLRPFVGPSGGRLEEWVHEVGLTRAQMYVTNVVPYRPTANEIRTVPKQELEDWITELHTRLAKLTDPWVLVPTGDTALFALTGKKGIMKWRGSLLEYQDQRGRVIKVIPTLHPAATFRSPSLERRCRFDWARIASDSQFRELRRPERSLQIRPTLADVQDLLSDARKRPNGALAIDIETPRKLSLVDKKLKSGKVKVVRQYGAARVVCVAFSLTPDSSLSIPTTMSYWGASRDVVTVWGLIRALCALPIPKVLQNGLFDRFYLQADHQVEVVNHLYDTMDMHHAWDSTDEHSLAYIASTWTREPYWKDDGKEDDEYGDPAALGDWDTFWEYNARDAAVTRELADPLRQALIEDKKWELYCEHYPPLREPLLDLMLRGIRRDPTACASLVTKLKSDLIAGRASIEHLVKAKLVELRLLPADDSPPLDAAWADFSLFGKKSISPVKLQRYLYEALRLPKRTRKNKATGERAVTTDEVALRGLAITYPHKCREVIGAVLNFRRTDKLTSFVSDGVPDADGYVRCSYRRATETHRLSSSKNPRRTGQNLQNVDRDVRSVYVPDPQTIFVECDLSQAEDRVVKAYTGDPRLIAEARAHPAEFDTHTNNARAIFGVETPTKDQRYLGKKVVHASNYGMAGKKLSEELLKENDVRTPDECQRLIDRRLELAPAILQWQQRTRMEVMRTRRLMNSWGWTIDFKYERLGEELYRRAYAWRPQSDIGILTNLWGLIPVWQAIQERKRRIGGPWARTRIALQVHDALVACAPPEVAYDVAVLMRECLERPHEYGGVELTIPIEVKIGTSWAMTTGWKRFPEREAFDAAVRGLNEGGAGR